MPVGRDALGIVAGYVAVDPVIGDLHFVQVTHVVAVHTGDVGSSEPGMVAMIVVKTASG